MDEGISTSTRHKYNINIYQNVMRSLLITIGTPQILGDIRDSVPRSKYWEGRVPRVQ